jgi:hypothetical protein
MKFKAYVDQNSTYVFEIEADDYASATRKLSSLVSDENDFFDYLSTIPHEVDTDTIVDTAVYPEEESRPPNS